MSKKYTVVIASTEMGHGEPEIGEKLMGAFISKLLDQETLPETILIYNEGVKLSVEGADTLEDLKELDKRGVRILTCGLCLDFYGIKDRLGVGEEMNMGQFVEITRTSDRVVRP